MQYNDGSNEIMTVEIPKREYRELIEDSLRLDLILEAIYWHAHLNSDGDELLSDYMLMERMRALTPGRYETTLAALQQKLQGDKE